MNIKKLETNIMDTKQRIRNYIQNNFGNYDKELEDSTPLLENAVIDSTGVTELVFFVKDEFGIEVPAEDILPGHFDSVASLANYVESRLSPK